MTPTPDPKTVKAVARALAIQHTLDRGYGADADEFNFMIEELTPQFLPNALAAISTLQEMGWRCVGEDEVVAPREPTEEMEDAADEPFHLAMKTQRDRNRARGWAPDAAFGSAAFTIPIYRAMIAAIAKASPPKPEEI